MNEETIEIEPEKLSESVRKDLKEDLNIDEDIIEDKTDEIKLNNMNISKPNQRSSLSIISCYIKNKYESYKLGFDSLSSTRTIEKLEPNNNCIKFITDNSNKQSVFTLCEGTTRLANLINYHNVNKVSDLEGKSILYKNGHYLIPEHYSFIDKLYHRIHNFTHKNYKIQQKMMGSTYLNMIKILGLAFLLSTTYTNNLLMITIGSIIALITLYVHLGGVFNKIHTKLESKFYKVNSYQD